MPLLLFSTLPTTGTTTGKKRGGGGATFTYLGARITSGTVRSGTLHSTSGHPNSGATHRSNMPRATVAVICAGFSTSAVQSYIYTSPPHGPQPNSPAHAPTNATVATVQIARRFETQAQVDEQAASFAGGGGASPGTSPVSLSVFPLALRCRLDLALDLGLMTVWIRAKQARSPPSRKSQSAPDSRGGTRAQHGPCGSR